MSLEEYQKKRDFAQTSEPEGAQEHEKGGPLRFVIQKHDATNLHYDLRLELDGVLKSWAVPKGPSLDPSEKKLAMMVEDHPLDYRHFEGVIAEGNYGAGPVIIWDEGFYRVPGIEGRDSNEAGVRQGLERGNLKIYLEGEKIQGEFALVKIKNEQANSWLLIKKSDQYASKLDILEQDYSVRSGKTLEEIEEQGKGSGKVSREEIDKLVSSGAQKAPMLTDIRPMRASLTDEPFDRIGWFFELKWDGFRAIAEVKSDQIRLYSRNLLPFEKEFTPIADELKKIKIEAIFDGEIVVVDQNGRADFQLLQNYRKTGEGLLVYYIFDLLYLEGYDLQGLPLARRKETLRKVLPDLPRIKFSDHTERDGKALFDLAVESGLEGIIAKNKTSTYQVGVRSQDWLKVKYRRSQEAVIGGFTQPRGSRTNMGALLLGVYEGDDLVYVGHTGGGFTEAELDEVQSRLVPLIRKTSPFKNRFKTNMPSTWVKPELVCEVRFSEWTDDGIMRQPIYMGMREDTDPRQVAREIPIPKSVALEPKRFQGADEMKEKVKIEGRELTLTNLNKVYWPDEVITKGDMIQYYQDISSLILPYLKDRPESLHRFPNGIQAKSFFQKNVTNAPEWVETKKIESENSDDVIQYLICQDEATLVYMANLGTIEINPWNSRIKSLDHPDYLIVDLDPDERPFEDVVQVALTVHELLEETGADNFIKTSGKTGLHICIPLDAKYDYDQTRQFANIITRLVNARLPEITSVERNPSKRKGLIYLDHLQNRRGQTLAAPYSLRPRPRATVSTPLRWEEVKPGLQPEHFHIKNIQKRVEKVGDLWKGVLGPGIDMHKCLSNLQERWKKSGKP
jgi:bifunctional non-homologous end joining protein LigD